MENSTINETTSWPENATVATSEDALSHILRIIAAPTDHQGLNELLMFFKCGLTSWFIRKIAKRSQPFTLQYDVLLLAICFFTLASKTVDVCALSCMWSFHITISQEAVWIPVIVLHPIMFLLLAFAPSYYVLLTFVVNILFIYTSCHLILGRSGLYINGLLNFIVVACGYAGCYGALYRTAGPNMDETSVILMMFVPMIAISLHSERPFVRDVIVASVISYCIYLKIKVYGITEPDENSSDLDEWISPSERHRLHQFESTFSAIGSRLLKLCSIDNILDFGTYLEKVLHFFH